MSLRMWRKAEKQIDVSDRRGFFDLAYGNDPQQRLDIFLPAGSGPFPLIISIHGGGFVACDKRQGDMISPMLHGLQAGFAVAAVNYRLAPQNKFPKAVNDVKQAVRFLRANADKYQLKPDQFATWGGSAGGYLSLMACSVAAESYFNNVDDPYRDVSAAVQCGVAWYAVSDFSTVDSGLKSNSIIKHALKISPSDHSDCYEPAFPEQTDDQFPFFEAANGSNVTFLGSTAHDNPTLAKLASPINYINEGLPPLLLQAGSGDEIIPMQQSINFCIKAHDILQDDRVRVEICPHAIHSSVRFETPENLDRVISFIQQHL